MNDELWTTALSTDEGTTIPVYVWLRVYEPVPDRFALSADPALDDAWEAESRHVRDVARQLFENDLTHITGNLRFEPGTPIA